VSVLKKRMHELHGSGGRGRPPALLSVCANPKCATGRLHVWRNRTAPVLEGGWSCSSGCTHARLAQLMRREGEQRSPFPPTHRHRIPVGLVLLKKGWISQEQLKKALDEQRAGNAGRIGAWFVEHCSLEEFRLTQALSIQWNCPVFSLAEVATLPAVSPVPRLFMESFKFFPVRLSNTGILYLAFEDRIDHSVMFAIERITGLRVEAGLVHGSEFEREHKARMGARFLPAKMVEAVSMESLLGGLTNLIEKEKPLDTKVVRVHDFYWLRLWKESVRPAGSPFVPADGILDVVCSLNFFR
jgi:hypothetical protein